MVRPRLLFSALVAALLAIVLASVARGAVGLLDLRVYDLLLRVAGGASPSGLVAVVAVDDESLDSIGRWPWSREVIATLVDRLHTLGASVIALDVLVAAEADRFGDQDGPESRPTTDAASGEAIGQSGVVLGYALTFGPPRAGAAECRLHPLSATVVEPPGAPPPSVRLFQATGCVGNVPALSQAAGASGFLNVGTDVDGVLRRFPLVMAFDNHVYPSLPLSAVQALVAPSQMTLWARSGRSLRLDIDGHSVPLDERGTLALRFRDSARHFERISAADVLNGRVASGALDGRIVFVGPTAAGVRDVVSTPLDRQYPSIEVYATAAENLLQRDFFVTLPYHRVYEVLATVGLALFTALLIGVFGFRSGSAAGALCLLAFWSACALMLGRWGRYMSPLMPTVAVAATMIAVAGSRIEIERQRLRGRHRRRQHTHELLVKSLTSLMEIRDPSTGRHSRRTQGYSRLLAQRLAHTPEFRDYLTPERIEFVSLLAPLHDIGKVGIRDAVLNKPSALSPDEMQEMRQHPVYGYETISKAQRQVGVDRAGDEGILQLAKDIVYTHHERWDGTGYPRGLRGHEIPVAGRIMALVDVYDALVEPRPYRRRMPHDEAVALIVAGEGTQFDPDVVEAFLTVAADFQELGTRLRESPPHPRR